MWINNSEMRDLLAKIRSGREVSTYELDAYEHKIQRAEERERQRQEQEKREKMAFYERIYVAMQKLGKATPTDLQFYFFQNGGNEYSNQKLTHALLNMRFGIYQKSFPGLDRRIIKHNRVIWFIED